jgi:DNA-binding SARP family transcriptional activator/predicted ATPase
VVSRLALYLLGQPRIECDGVPVKMDRRKATALAAYLAVTGESHRRDSLVNLLWPEYDDARGRAALRRTLHALKKSFASDYLHADREEVGLYPGASLWVDIVIFRQSLAESERHGHPQSDVCADCVVPLTDAVSLVRGDFLSGFGLKDSAGFDDWQLFQAEEVRRELAGALERLARWHSAQSEFELAIGCTKRRLSLDPLDEPAHQQLMSLYAWSGQRSAALRQYEECRAILEDQLGVPPQEATTGLFQAIRLGRVPPPPSAQPPRVLGGTRELASPSPQNRLFDTETDEPSFLKEGLPVERPLFVAREEELAQMRQHLSAALNGQGKVVFVTGDAGSGKTALIQEFAQRALAEHSDLIIAGGHGNAHTGVGDPYLPFREIMGLLTGDVEAQWSAGAMTREHARRLWNTLPIAAEALVEVGQDLIGTFVPRAALANRVMAYAPRREDWLAKLDSGEARKPAAGSSSSGTEQSDLFEQYTRVLQTLSRRSPLALVLDDLQWADAGAINLLFHLGRHLSGSRILVVGAYRPEEVASGREGARHPLVSAVNELQRVSGDSALDVDQAKSRDLVEALLDSEPNRLGRVFRDRLFQKTQGHPLFTVELLRGMQERGDLITDREGCWVEGPALDWEILPARVEAAIAERIGRLAAPLQEALRIACVEGEEFTAEVVARILGTDERKTVQLLSGNLDRRHRLVRAQAIERLGSQRISRYRFRHHLFQKYLYDRVDKVERAYLHEEVGNVLETLYADDSSETAAVAPQLARHFQEAGVAEKAISYLLLAGERAVQMSAYHEAIAHLNGGFELLMSLPDSPERAQQELALRLVLGMAWIGVRGSPAPEVKASYTRARELCQQMGEASQLCRVLGELTFHHYVRAEHRTARDLAGQALRAAQRAGDPLLVALGHWYVGVVCFAQGEYETSRAYLGEVISRYDPERRHRSFVALHGSDAGLSALSYDACCLWCLGYPEQASKLSQEALSMARELDHPFTLADVLAYAGCMFSAMRRDAEALEDSAEELIRLSAGKVPAWSETGNRFRGVALALMGQVEKSMAEIRYGMSVGESQGVRCYFSGMLGSLGRALATAGQLEEGLRTLDDALSFVEETGERHWEAELCRQQAELLLMRGDGAGAEASLHKAIAVAVRQGAKSWELRATTDLARLWQRQGKGEEAKQVLAPVYGWFTEGFDTLDLREAKALLEELNHRTTS